MWFESHPTSEEFEGFLGVNLRREHKERTSRIVRHLLSGCRACRGKLLEMGWSWERLDRLVHLYGSEALAEPLNPAAVSSPIYDCAFAAADRALADFLTADRPIEQSPAELLAELAALPEAEQIRQIAEDRFARPQLVKSLIEQSHDARYEDPETMLYLADLARRAAEACAAESTGSRARLADLRTKAWGHYGNSLRVCGRLEQAQEALAKAEEYCAAGTGDPPVRARLYEQRASLATYQRHFEAAMDLAEEAGEIYHEIGDAHRFASSLVHKAIAALYAGTPASAVHLLNRAIPMIDQEDDPHLLVAACHNLIRCYIDLDQPEQALFLHFKSRDLYKEFKDILIRLRASWQEGQLLRELGHLEAAEAALQRARKGFLERGLSYEVAVVSLDLSTVYVKLGSAEQVRKIVTETMPIFRSLRVGREALALLIQLLQVADQEHQALALIRLLSEHLEQVSQRRLLK
jgi:tetratricopeptide (TPR) repeat protein